MLSALKTDRRIRYLLVGAVNTLVGYLCGLGLYYSLSPRVHLLAIGIIINVLCISFSFLNYKIFVFKTKGRWLREYLRCYIVYGGGALFGIVGPWILVDFWRVDFWLAQGGLTGVMTVFFYLAHSRFSFAPVKESKIKGSSHDI